MSFYATLVCLFLVVGCSGGVKNEPTLTLSDTSTPIFIKTDRSNQFLPENVLKNESEYSDTHIKNKHLEQDNFYEANFYEFSLNNNLKILLLPHQALPDISISIIVEAGEDQILPSDDYLSPLVLKLLKQGTKKYTKKELQKRVSLLGKPLKYWQTPRFSVISAHILPQDLELTIDMLAQQIAYIEPDSNAYQTVIEQQLLENKLAQSSGSYLAELLFYQKNYSKSHLYYALQPKSHLIKAVSASEMLDFYGRKYGPSKSTLIIAGHFDLNNTKKMLAEYFSHWDNENEGQTESMKMNSQNTSQLQYQADKPVLSFIQRKGAQQIDLLFGVVTIPRLSEDWLALKILASILGGGPSSRLFADLREKQGLAYYISAQQISGRYASPFFIRTSIAYDNLIPTIQGINKHLERLCHHTVETKELALIKQQLRGEIIFKLQTNQQKISNKIHQLEHSLGNDYLSDLSHLIANVTGEQLLKVANRYLCSQHHFIAVGDISQIQNDFSNELKDYDYKEYNLPLE